jgi:hypothetical protein
LSKLETMLRIFLANFIVQVLPLLMIAAAILLVLKARKGGSRSSLKHYLGISLAALPAGIIAYIIAGIAAATVRREGHFYSVPFGGYTVYNGPIVISVVLWIAFVFAVLAFVLRPRE